MATTPTRSDSLSMITFTISFSCREHGFSVVDMGKMKFVSVAHVVSLSLLVVIAAHAGDWPQWRGPERDGHAAQDESLASSLPQGLKPDWRIEIGGGFSSPVISAGKLVYMDGCDGKEVAHLIDANTSKENWQTPIGSMYEDEWGPGARSTPLIDGDRIYVQTCKGEFRCLNFNDGKPIWGTSFEKDFGVRFLGSRAEEGTASRRGNNGSGVVDGDHIILQVGSQDGASLVCFEKRTGKILWKSQNDEAAYSSLMLANFGGVKQVVYFSGDALLAVKAEDGKLLWRWPLTTFAKRHAATPIIFNDCVIVSSHTFGLLSLHIAKDETALKAEKAWQNREMKINIATPVLVDNFLYSQGPGRNLVCVDATTGKLMWSHEGFGEKLSSVIAIGKKLLVVTDRGELVLLEADGQKCAELGRAQVSGKTWNSPAVANGKLYVREGLNSGWKLSRFTLDKATVQ
jgi:outer membrane protein assembly factor BamB